MFLIIYLNFLFTIIINFVENGENSIVLTTIVTKLPL